MTLGPLTNLAIALNVEPNLPEFEIGRRDGGAYSVPGNTTPAAEFNILSILPQNKSSPRGFRPHHGWARRDRAGSRSREMIGMPSTLPQPFPPRRPFSAKWASSHFPHLGREQFSLHDPLSVAVAIDPT